jgi:hypothetical protein
MGAARGLANADDHKRLQHVCRGRCAACCAGRVWRGACGRLASLFADHDRLRRRRPFHGTAGRSIRRHGTAADRRAQSRSWLRRRGDGRQHLDLFTRARSADRRVRKLGDVRAAYRRHIALVHAQAWNSGCNLRQRKLSRGSRVATGRAPLRRDLRLAQHLRGHRTLLRCDAVVLGAIPAPQTTRGRQRRRFVGHGRLVVPAFRTLPGRGPISAMRGGSGVLRRNVDATSAYRRLLRRPRLRRRARRRDAVGHAALVS